MDATPSVPDRENAPPKTWVSVCVALVATAVLIPYYMPDATNGLDGTSIARGWYFAWELSHITAILTLGWLLCAIAARSISSPKQRVWFLLAVAVFPAAWIAVQVYSVSQSSLEHVEEGLGIVETVLWCLRAAGLTLSVGLIAASAFRLHRGMLAGDPFRWMRIAALVGIVCHASGVWIERNHAGMSFDAVAWRVLVALYLLLGLATGWTRSERGRSALTLGARVGLGVAFWLFLLGAWDVHTQPPHEGAPWTVSLAYGLRELSQAIAPYLAAALAFVDVFHLRTPYPEPGLAAPFE